MGVKASQITGVSFVYSIVCSGANQRKHQSFASLAFGGEFTGTGDFPQSTSNAENVPIWWRRDAFMAMITEAQITMGTYIFVLPVCIITNMPEYFIMFSFWLSSWWRHQMEAFSALLAFCAGNSPVSVKSQYTDRWRGALMFSLVYAWMHDWVNNREAGDLRRHRGHYDVIVMLTFMILILTHTQCWAELKAPHDIQAL